MEPGKLAAACCKIDLLRYLSGDMLAESKPSAQKAPRDELSTPNANHIPL
jgi:hypothetical protein